MNYNTILFDLDNTLLDFHKAEASAIRKVLLKNNYPSDDNAVKTYSDINKSFWERFERGEIPRTEIFTGRFLKFFEVFGLTGDANKISEEYGGFLSEEYCTVDGTFEILGYLKNKGYKLYAITNGFTRTQVNRISKSGLEPYFDDSFISEQVGFQKPDKEYFNFVVEHIPEKDRSKMLIVGDSMSSDILGGINAGIDTCWFNPSLAQKIYQPTYEIKNLSELSKIL